MPWMFNNTEFNSEMIGDYVGFVYIIDNNSNGRRYVGKKLFYKSKWLPITKSRKKRKKVKVESDWKDYWGSCKELLDDINELGKHRFRRKILRLCKTKGDLSYYETQQQILRDVLRDDRYYNNIVQCRIHSKHLSEEKL